MDRREHEIDRTDLARSYRLINPSDLGDRIRDARILAGRTQSDIAGGEVTAAYISRVESGQRKPEFHLLERIAARANTTLAVLLAAASARECIQVSVVLDHAELSLVTGDAATSLQRVEKVLSDVPHDHHEPAVAAARRTRALALEAMGDTAKAIAALEELTTTPRTSPEFLRCLTALCRCYRDAGDLDQAIIGCQRAQGLIAELGLDGLPEAVEVSLILAEAHLRRGELDHSIRIYTQVSEASDQHPSPLQQAIAYWNASIAESELGDNDTAHALAQKALAYHQVAADAQNLSRLRTQFALAQLKRNPPDAVRAAETLDRAEADHQWAPVGTIDKAVQTLARSRAHFILGHRAKAKAALNAFERIAPSDSPELRAAGHALAAQIAIEDRQVETARQRTEQAIDALNTTEASVDGAQLWVDLASVLQAVGDMSAAIEALRRAASAKGLCAMKP